MKRIAIIALIILCLTLCSCGNLFAEDEIESVSFVTLPGSLFLSTTWDGAITATISVKLVGEASATSYSMTVSNATAVSPTVSNIVGLDSSMQPTASCAPKGEGYYDLTIVFEGVATLTHTFRVVTSQNLMYFENESGNVGAKVYGIANAQQFANIVLGDYTDKGESTTEFKLLNDIDFANSCPWVDGDAAFVNSAGVLNYYFTGTLDGNNKRILNFYSDKTASYKTAAGSPVESGIGLFHTLGGTCIIKNLDLVDCVYENPNAKGAGLFGFGTESSTTDYITFNNVRILGDSKVIGDTNLGGFIGYARALASNDEGIAFYSCVNNAYVCGTSMSVGGFVGSFTSMPKTLIADHCTNNGTIIGTNIIGGIFGLLRPTPTSNTLKMTYCTNTGDIYTTAGGCDVSGYLIALQKVKNAEHYYITETNNGEFSNNTNTGSMHNNTGSRSATIKLSDDVSTVKFDNNNGLEKVRVPITALTVVYIQGEEIKINEVPGAEYYTLTYVSSHRSDYTYNKTTWEKITGGNYTLLNTMFTKDEVENGQISTGVKALSAIKVVIPSDLGGFTSIGDPDPRATAYDTNSGTFYMNEVTATTCRVISEGIKLTVVAYNSNGIPIAVAQPVVGTITLTYHKAA